MCCWQRPPCEGQSLTQPSKTDVKLENLQRVLWTGWVCTGTKMIRQQWTDNLDKTDNGSGKAEDQWISGEQTLVTRDNLSETMPLLRLTPSINKLRHKMLSLLSSTVVWAYMIRRPWERRIPLKLASSSGVCEVKSYRGKETVLSWGWDWLLQFHSIYGNLNSRKRK